MDLISPDFIDNFHFLRPLLLLGIIPALGLVLIIRFLQNNQSTWNQAIAAELLPFLLDEASTPKRHTPLYALLLIWTLAFVAMAGPVWQQIPVPVQEREDAMVIVLDMSLSMYSNDLTPNRLVRAQRKLIDILNSRQEEGQTALVVYAGDAHAVTPLTDDVETIKTMVPALEPSIMPEYGSKPDRGIALAIDLLTNSNIAEAQIVLITDGVRAADISAIRSILADTNHSLAILGVGTESGAPIPMAEGGFLRDQQNAIVIPRLQRELLQDLARTVAGRYTDSQLTDADINYLFDQRLFDENEDLVESEREFDSWYETGPWLLVLLLPCAAFAFRKGWLLSLCLLAIMVPEQQALAWEWNQLWNNKDQLGNQSFLAEDYQQSAELFKDESWRAAANYRNGNFEQALAGLEQQDDINSLYNRGNTLARLNRLEEAIATYEQVLEQQPDHDDAQQNKEIVEALLTQQQEEEEQEQQQNSSGENQDQEEQDGEQEQQEGENQQQQNQDQQQDPSDQQSGDQQEQEQNQNEDGEDQDESEESDGEEEQEGEPQSSQGEQPDSEEEQAMQQYLRRIQDNPGELLRNKFRYQSQQRLYERLQNPNLSEQEGEQQIW